MCVLMKQRCASSAVHTIGSPRTLKDVLTTRCEQGSLCDDFHHYGSRIAAHAEELDRAEQLLSSVTFGRHPAPLARLGAG